MNFPRARAQLAAAVPWAQWRRLFGLLLVGSGLVLLLTHLYDLVAQQDTRVHMALMGGLVAAGATALGTVPVLLSQQFSERFRDTLLGFGAGVMLAASAFSLVVPALKAAHAQGAGNWGAGLQVSGGILLGALLLLAIDHWLPHEHFIKGLEGPKAKALKRTWLFVLAISLHNVPEGLAIGVAYGGTDPVGAGALTTGISIQDVPEGLVVALALRAVGYRRRVSAALGVLSGLVEPVGAVFGAAVITLSAALLPWGLAFAAGAMLFVISHEIIPESHRAGHEKSATTGLIFGFVLMMLLDTALG